MDAQDLFSQLARRSNAFHLFTCHFSTRDNRIEAIVRRAEAEGGAAAGAEARKGIEADALGTRVVAHWRVWRLLDEFLSYKREFGTGEEKEVYRDMDSHGLVHRLIAFRPLSFLTASDSTLLRHPELRGKAREKLRMWTEVWDLVGTRETATPASAPLVPASAPTSASVSSTSVDAPPVAAEQGQGQEKEQPFFLSLADYLSYDEIQLAALLGTSTPTLFINDGDRYNCGEHGRGGSFERHGVYMGLVGPRFERWGRMEDEWVVVRRPGQYKGEALPVRALERPEAAAARAKMWMRALGLEEDYWAEVVQPFKTALASAGTTAAEVKGGGSSSSSSSSSSASQHLIPPPDLVQYREFCFFNRRIYTARIRITAETQLLEANARAEAQGRKAYVHVVGLGLGVWKVGGVEKQEEWYLDAFAQVVEQVQLPFVHTINFSYFHLRACGRFPSDSLTDGLPSGNRVRIRFSKRAPAALLDGRAPGAPGGPSPSPSPSPSPLLLVAAYAWDGNAYPGNEYWLGNLAGSGDPAAVCCSTIGELQNPLINHFTHNVQVLGQTS